MLLLEVPISNEGWDEAKQEFLEAETVTIELEHSLVSLSKWESKWCKTFISKQEKTPEETLDYIRCMTITENIDPSVYTHLTEKHFEQINSYIEAPMTATYFSEQQSKGGSREVITSELIYYWMIALQIPFECQYWHLNRLLTLVRVCNLKNQPPKKMSKRDIMSRNASLNAARRQQFNSRG